MTMFKKMIKPKYPPRHWSLVGYPGSGKSTFAAKMNGPKLGIDSDHRFSEAMEIGDDTYALSDDPMDNVDTDNIYRELHRNMPNSGIKTIIVDSLTAIITPIVMKVMIDKEKGRSRNLMAGMKEKAMAMRQLQDAVSRWGTDILWIYHLQDGRDGRSNEVTKNSISETELARLMRSINLRLKVVQNENLRGIEILWARRGRSNITIWDESGTWDNMPTRIEEAVYENLSDDEKMKIESDAPSFFPDSETAIAWGFEKEAFTSIQGSRMAYENLKTERNPKTAQEMAAYWVTKVQSKIL